MFRDGLGGRHRTRSQLTAVTLDLLFIRSDRRMHVVVRKEKEKWLVRIFFQKRDRFVRQSFRDVFTVCLGFQVGVFPGRVVSAWWRSFGAAANVSIETLVGRPIPFVSQVPFAREERPVMVGFEGFCNRDLFQSQIVTILDVLEFSRVACRSTWNPVGNVDANGMSARHDAGPRR